MSGPTKRSGTISGLPFPKRRGLASSTATTSDTTITNSQTKDVQIQKQLSGDTIITVTDGQGQCPLEILQIPHYDLPN